MRPMRTNRLRYFLTASLLSLLLVAAAWADVKYESTTKVKLGGKLGAVVGAMGKLGLAPMKSTETVYVKGDKMRTDESRKSTIVDLEGERIITLNRKKKTYTVLTFEEMRKRFEEMMASAEEGQEAAEEAGAEPAGEQAEEQPTTELKFDLSVDRTGEKKKINGYRAERVIMTLTAEATNVAPEESEEQGVEGSLVTVSEVWVSKDVKGYDEAEAFRKRMAEAIGEAMLGARAMASLKNAFQQDPRLKEALEKAQDEFGKMEGVPILTTTYMVSVPAGLEFNRDLVFQKKKKKKRGFGGLARLAKKAVESKAGVEGGDEEKAAAPPKQSTILTVTTALKKISTKSLSDGLFAIPQDYREVQR